MGKKSDNSKGGTIRLVAAFFGGCFSTLLWLSMKERAVSNGCAISFGTYKGTEYSSAAGGTVGQPKCLVESKLLKVQQHSVQLPVALTNGKPSGLIYDWLWIDYHDRINVLIEAERSAEEPHFLIFEQTKYALEGRESMAIVGGIIEPGEQPEQAAYREVLEETGQNCATFHFLGRYRTDVNRGMGWTNTYVASDCQKQRQERTESKHGVADEVGVADTERQDLRTVSLTDVRNAVQAGQFLEIQWSATVALAMLYYDQQASK
jgi:8-oxo-dGTP pyrophosphatase MutT (NUDIX family)